MTTLMMKLARWQGSNQQNTLIAFQQLSLSLMTPQRRQREVRTKSLPHYRLPTKIPSASCQTWSDLRISETLLYQTTQKPTPPSMISRIASRRLCAAASRRAGSSRSGESAGWNARSVQRRWMTPAPKPGDGPMMSRRADRELPGEFLD